MKDRNTTICGILTILAAACSAGVLYLHGNPTGALAALGTGITTGLGLIKAADSGKPADSGK